MVIGYSLSPGGLLFPYHIGALAGLQYHKYLDDSNPLAGSSAGAIAVASHAAGVPPQNAIEATIRMAQDCDTMGGARGNLLPLLEKELNTILDDDVHEILNNRKGLVGLAYREIFPMNRPVLDTKYCSKEHVVDSVCNSCMFPFFSSNWPCRLSSRQTTKRLPRVVVDGFFAVPRGRFGCPDFNMATEQNSMEEGETIMQPKIVDRTVTISVIPHKSISLTASEEHDQISPQLLNPEDSRSQLSRLIQLATQTAPKEEYHKLYEDGWKDVEKWIKNEERRNSQDDMSQLTGEPN